jgi:hypothetical protein
MTQQADATLEGVMAEVEQLRARVQELHRQTGNEDLEHADLGLQIVHHALEEVAEHTGLGGHIKSTPDKAIHDKVKGWMNDVRSIKAAAEEMLATTPNEDLETAIKALEIASGSLHEVEERYE